MYENMHDALEMREDRHARLTLNASDEAFAAARDDDVEIAPKPGEHFANGGAVLDGHTGYRRSR